MQAVVMLFNNDIHYDIAISLSSLLPYFRPPDAPPYFRYDAAVFFERWQKQAGKRQRRHYAFFDAAVAFD